MYAQMEKSKENKSRAVANSVAQQKSSVKQGFGFVNNRAESIAQRIIKKVETHDPIQLVDKRFIQVPSKETLVLQAQWAYVDVDGGTRLNLTKTSDPTVFTLKSDSTKYKVIGTAGNGDPIVQKIGAIHEDWRFDQFTEYQNWTKTTSGVSVTPPFGVGNVSAYHNRGAPKISSRQSDFGGAKLGDSYVEYQRGLQSGGLTDSQIATALLNLDDSALTSDLEKRAASMLHVTVYLAEEWRKQGAAKIYRAILRNIAQGKSDFSTFDDDFKFIASADEGRQQVARFHDVQRGDESQSRLSISEQQIYGNMSPLRQQDFESGDEMEDEKALKSMRDYSEQNSSAKGWGNPW